MLHSRFLVLALSAFVVTACTSPDPVPDRPNILRFDATPAVVSPGESAALAWEVTGAQSISINEGVGEVSGTTAEVRPDATTTYTLTATNDHGSTTANATVVVTTTGGTNLSGDITTRTLPASGSPYLVTGDVTVPEGNRLTLEPGVRLVFTGHFKLAVLGRITAQGTAERPIVFTAANPTTGWAGMRLAATSDGGADFLERCIFEYGNKVGGENGAGDEGSYSENAGGALWIGSRSNVNLNNNTFRFNKAPAFGGAIMLIAPTSGGVAAGNVFHDNECTGPRTQFGGVGGAVNTAHLPASNHWTFRGGEFRNNRAPEGGALYFFDSNVTLDGIAMSGNTPNNWGTPEPQRLTVINTPR
ncbi:Outer membrane protein A precursor [Myxococcus hansupus]|uniref:Outer membrane protein A n=1 Tax=Pseudomyxococcus hansupus TaxID=1297742 RepID=A0A0H4WMR9_9BACT|nr:hypothetical protein [Myxococcus hansupus]AKQ64706.1 Outer membrane protein A precursor [Myxococcus hansupus]